MKWSAIGALAAAGALLAGGAYWVGSHDAPPKPEKAAQRDAKLESEVVALRKEMELLKLARVTSIGVPASETKTAALPAKAPAPGPNDAPPPSENEERTAAETNRQIASELDARYTEEPRDGAWSAGTVRKIRDATSSIRGARLIEANCATSLCRVVLGHGTEDEQREIGMQVVSLDPFKNGVFFDYDKEPGALKTTLYVLREGKTFNDVRQSSL